MGAQLARMPGLRQRWRAPAPGGSELCRCLCLLDFVKSRSEKCLLDFVGLYVDRVGIAGLDPISRPTLRPIQYGILFEHHTVGIAASNYEDPFKRTFCLFHFPFQAFFEFPRLCGPLLENAGRQRGCDAGGGAGARDLRSAGRSYCRIPLFSVRFTMNVCFPC